MNTINNFKNRKNMEEQVKKGFVQIPEPTLKALKGLLYNSKDGVDLSPITKDISFPGNEDITAINVGLVYKGLTPEIDTCPHIFAGEVLEFVGFSLIMGMVKTKNSKGEFVGFSYEEWINAEIAK